MPDYFDLNIEDVLDNWPVEFAIREIVANALDEMHMTATDQPTIAMNDGGWIIRDYGRGLSHEHLTQRENPEKLGHAHVIGQFGMGLKDALAVFDRRGIGVAIRSRHGDVSTERRAKAGFDDVKTLHAVISGPADASFVGTEVRLGGVSSAEMEAAKAFFLRYSSDRVLETTKFGDVLAKAESTAPGRVYVRGILVAEEPNFLFSYNITNLNKAMRSAMNRERSNVGRSAYSERVKQILLECRGTAVAEPLAADLNGDGHDELKWEAVGVHACRILATNEDVVFVTRLEAMMSAALIEQAREEGKMIVIVPDKIADKLHAGVTDLDGRTVMDLGSYNQDFNDRFEFTFIDPSDLEPRERVVYDMALPAVELAGIRRSKMPLIRISETMQLNSSGAEVVAIYSEDEHCIVIKRAELAVASDFLGSVLFMAVEQVDREFEGTSAFASTIAQRAGILAEHALNSH